MKNILILNYELKKNNLIDFLKAKKFKVYFSNKPLKLIKNLKFFELIISFNQTDNLEEKHIKMCRRPILNHLLLFTLLRRN